jgi:methyl-accepting chemotaxis protein
VPSHPVPGPSIPHDPDLLAGWAALAQIDLKASAAMAEEVSACSALIEDSATDLSARFRALAKAADAQTARVERIAEIARSIQVAGQSMTLADATRVVQTVLAEAIDGLSAVAQQARRMGSALAGVTQEFTGVESCMTRIDDINRQAKFVAINAMIEAQRDEGGSAAFKVIAHELKELSKETDATSRMVRERVARAATGVSTAQAELATIAANDQASLDDRRQRLDAIIGGMVAQNGQLAGVTEAARGAAKEIDGIVAGLVTGTQFQDRASQHLAQVVGTLTLLGDAKRDLQHDTEAALPAIPEVGTDHPVVARILASHSLTAVRRRFLQHIGDPGAEAAPELAPAGDDIELF